MRRSRIVIPLLAATTIASIALPASGSTPPTPKGHDSRAAAVTKVNGWTRLSDSHVTSLSEPDALPLSTGGAQVIWYQQDASSSESIRTRIVKESGALGSSIASVVKGWGAIIDDPKIISYGSDRMVVFAGLRSSSSSDKYNGPLVYATSSNGSAWTLGSGSLSETGFAYGSYGTAAIDDGGTPVASVVASSTNFVTVHRGISPTIPATSGDWTTTPLSGNSLYASLGRDAKTGAIWSVWVQDFGSTAQNGIIAQRVYPKPIGTWQKAPQSTTKSGDFISSDQGVAVASRAGGEVWAAYKVGYPTANAIALWRVGSTEVHLIKTSDVDKITLKPAPGGRLWLAWYSSTSGKVKVTRTNPSVTRIGAVASFKPPTSKAYPYPSVWSIGGTGRGGPLHLVINAQIGSASPQIWYRKVLPGLTLVAKPRSLDKGTVVAKVTDAGKAVAGARVSFLGHTKTTTRLGTVRFKVGAAVPKGKKRMTASKAGYAQGHAVVKVT